MFRKEKVGEVQALKAPTLWATAVPQGSLRSSTTVWSKSYKPPKMPEKA